MFIVARLEPNRQVIVGNAIAIAILADRTTPLAPSTVTRGNAVVQATTEVRIFAGITPIQVDRATDSIVIGFEHLLIAQEQMLRDTAVALGESQRVVAGCVRRLRLGLFAQGTDFTRRPMDIQWGELVALRGRMQEPDNAAAIDTLGLRPFADHALAHIDLYGRVVGHDAKNAGAGEEQATAAWLDAFRLFAAQVMLDYENDKAIQSELLGTYRAQLEQQRAVARAARRPAPLQPAPEPAPAQAPAAGQPAPDAAVPIG